LSHLSSAFVRQKEQLSQHPIVVVDTHAGSTISKHAALKLDLEPGRFVLEGGELSYLAKLVAVEIS
jgi:hypothetical protein